VYFVDIGVPYHLFDGCSHYFGVHTLVVSAYTPFNNGVGSKGEIGPEAGDNRSVRNRVGKRFHEGGLAKF